jgi:Mrp family chromosome partitioning ATPase
MLGQRNWKQVASRKLTSRNFTAVRTYGFAPSLTFCDGNATRHFQHSSLHLFSSSGPLRLHSTTAFNGGKSVVGASPRQMADLEEKLWRATTSNVTDPELGVDLRKLGWVNRRLAVSTDPQNGSQTIQMLLQVPTLLHPSLEELKRRVQQEAESEVGRWMAAHGLSVDESSSSVNVNVEVLPRQPVPWLVQAGQQDQEEVTSRLGPGLSNVSHFLAVYSCKGGVGKSTVAINLAYELARLGGRVGLLDVDIYGPSLPFLIHPDDPAVRRSPLGSSMVYPIEHRGVKMLSLGFVSSNSGVPGSGNDGAPAILRGPMAGRVTTQLLKGTDWGDLDVLILDLPPGTGDVQLTVCQEVDLSCAVGVTTPSKLAIADSKKGISMFSSMGIDTIAMVENMAYFECDAGKKHFPFGKGFAGGTTTSVTAHELSNEKKFDAERVCQLPISEVANEANEDGVPLCLSRPKNAEKELKAFEKLASIVVKELYRLPYQTQPGQGTVMVEEEKFDLSSIKLSQDKGHLIVRFFSDAGALQKRIAPQRLRQLDPKTGQLLQEEGGPSNNDAQHRQGADDGGMVSIYRAAKNKQDIEQPKIVPENVTEKGRVGFEVRWSDGAKFIYSRRAIAIAAGGSIIS